MEAVPEISMEGFRVVSGDYFSNPTRPQVPIFTVWDRCIGFSKQDIAMLNNCENIIIQINAEERKVLISPALSNDKDAVRWAKKDSKIEARKINCPRLSEKLYEMWGWDKQYIYRSVGKLVTSGNKVMLLFDFSEPEKWKRPGAKNV